MKNLNIKFNNNLLEFLLFILFLCFPVTIILRSATLNSNVILISILVIYFLFKKENFVFFKNDLIIFLLVFFSYIFLNNVINFVNIEILIKSIGNFRYLLISIGVFFILQKISTKYKKVFLYSNLLLIIGVGSDIIYQNIFNQNIFGFYPSMCETDYTNCTRYSGVFGDELVAGAFLSQLGLLILFQFPDFNLRNNFLYSFLKIISFIFLFLFILLTGERVALIIFLVSIFFFFYFNKKLKIFFTIIFLKLVLIYILSINSFVVKARYLEFFDSWNSSNNISSVTKVLESPWIYHYRAAYELFLEKPIIGHGSKSFRIKCKNTQIEKKLNQKIGGYKSCATHPHNYVMEFLSEFGIIGLLFFLTFFFKMFFKLNKLREKKSSDNLQIILGIGSLLLAIIFPLKPSGSFLSTFNASILFYILGFFLYYLEKIK